MSVFRTAEGALTAGVSRSTCSPHVFPVFLLLTSLDYSWGPKPKCQVGNINERIGPDVRKTAAMMINGG